MIDMKELKAKIEEQVFRFRKAKSTGMLINQETERTKNVLLNNVDGIIEALDYAIGAEEKIERLTVEIESADAELQEKDDEIAELKKQNGKKVAGKRATDETAGVK